MDDVIPRPYPFRYGRLFACLAPYCALCWFGAGWFHDRMLPVSYQIGWIIILMLALIGVCMVTERGPWRVWQRAAFVPAAWAAYMVIRLQTGIATVFLTGIPPKSFVESRGQLLISSLPIVIYAMWRSRLFTRGKFGNQAAGM